MRFDRQRLRPSPLTLGLLLAAVGGATWAHLDARRTEDPAATLVSSRSSAWRVLPELATLGAAGSTIELWPARGEPVRLVPRPGGHAVWVGERILGPADPEAMEGIWDSLRLATTVRAVVEGADTGLGDGGRIVVALPDDAGVRTLVLGRPTADEAGVYGAIEGGAEGTEGQWVLEREMSALVQQAPEAWLARRAVVAEPADVSAVVDGDVRIERGLDGLWRATRAGEGAVLLDGTAVGTRLQRLLSARLDPWVEPGDDAGEPWITLEGVDGVDWGLRTHGPCPGREARVLVSRGPGRWGCLDAAVVVPWPVPGRAVERPEALVEPRLLPHVYGRVLRVEQLAPTSRVLQRWGGGWRLEESIDGRIARFDVDEPEVFRWYEALHDAEVGLGAPPPGDDPGPPDVELRLLTDSTVTLRVRCHAGPPWRCRRDDGPWLELRQAEPRLAFDPDTFAPRRLAELSAEDVRAIEILAGPAGDDVLRQSAHFDLGVWRLDAPLHPEGDAALDAMRLEAMLGALAGLRAEAWVDGAADDAALRRVRVERVPRRDQAPTLEVELLPDCVVRMEGHRPARLSEGTCETLGQDLLVEWPLQRAIDTARGLELTRSGRTARLERQGEVWAHPDGAPEPEANAWLQRMHERTAPRVRRAAPPSAATWRLRVLPTRGTAYAFEGADAWARIEGEDWWYQLDETSESSEASEASDDAESSESSDDGESGDAEAP